MSLKTVYVGMGLTQAPQEFREDFQKSVKDELRKIGGIEVLDFVGLQGSTETEVYRYDRQCTEDADLCVFIVDHPSIGLGMEIAFRLGTKKPMLIFAKEDVYVTRMLTGMCKQESVFLYRYTRAADIALRVTFEVRDSD
jgi:nucleoside 2-deoxyribosyltransferase